MTDGGGRERFEWMRRGILLILAFAAPVAAEVKYNRDIRPLLADRCFACHGFDPGKRKGDLRLDTREGATLKNGEGRAAVVPGDVESSELWKRLVTTDEDDVMPPPESHKTVNEAEKALLKRWIEEGAVYEAHWAFTPPVVVVAPGGGHPVDAFLGAGFGGLKASGEADRATLIRRVTMALTGLPPSVAESEAFLADGAEGAYERVVDRLLGSPHYGEEMARPWLDAARYGDTHGMHLDNERQMWAYRDWVVRAFNENLPFDRFSEWQIAGDLMPEGGADALIATGFNRCNVTTGEGGSIDAELIFRYAVDRTATMAQTWLGLTAGCAVCHDHKYDPITQKDFYSLYAFFVSNADPAMDGNTLLTEPVVKVKAGDSGRREEEWRKKEMKAREELASLEVKGGYLDPADADPRPEPVTVERVWFEDGFPEGSNPGAVGHPVQLVKAPEPVFSGAVSLKRGGAGLAQDYYESGGNPLVVPDGAEMFLMVYLDPADPPEEVMVQFHSGGTWQHRAVWGADLIEFGKKGTTERYVAGPLPEVGKWVRLNVPAARMGMAAGLAVTGYAFTVNGGTVWFDHLGFAGKTDPANDPGVSFAAWRRSVAGKDLMEAPEGLRQVIKDGPEKAVDAELIGKLRSYYVQEVCAGTEAVLAGPRGVLAEVKRERGAAEAQQPSTFVFRDLPTPRDAFVMVRGQYDKPGEKVGPATPGVLPAMTPPEGGRRPDRRDLARWITDRRNPLTARVIVNRFWQQLFGTGLVETSHDFGTQGSVPTHPELLDWLAVWWQDRKWDTKQLVRLLVTSGAFRRDSAAPAAAWLEDPANRRLARGPRLRLDAEQLRDQALFAGGLLVREMGGKGVKPYQPPNIWEPVAYTGSNTRFYEADNGSALYRRSLYTFIKRTAPAPYMVNFDAPSREQACTRRERSNTPLQALQLMNDVQHVEAARGLAGEVMRAAADNAGRIAGLYRRVLVREPRADETAVLERLLGGELARYRAAPEAAQKAVTFGASVPPAGVDAVELAAWTLVAGTVLNLDEAINRN